LNARVYMKRTAIALVLLVAGTVLLCACLYCGLPRAGATWKSTNFSDDKFLVLLFPREDNTSCRRAVRASDWSQRDMALGGLQGNLASVLALLPAVAAATHTFRASLRAKIGRPCRRQGPEVPVAVLEGTPGNVQNRQRCK
jgi:hypothetical protein